MATVTKGGAGKAGARTAAEAPRIDRELMEPGDFEANPDDVFQIDVFVRRKGNRWVVCSEPESTEQHWVRFRMWTFDEEIDLRKRATVYDKVNRLHLVDQDKMNRLKVQKLLLGWSFSAQNPRLKLHHVQGVLTDEGWKNFKRLHVNILRHVLETMNSILEANG